MPFATLAVAQAIETINLTGLLATFMALSVVLIPVIGLTARFALKPTVDALGRFFDKKGSEDVVSILERRMALIEQQVESIESTVQRFADTADFDQKLAEPPRGPAQIAESGLDE